MRTPVIIRAKRYDIPFLIRAAVGQGHDMVGFEVNGTFLRLEAGGSAEVADPLSTEKHGRTHFPGARIRRGRLLTLFEGFRNGELIDEGLTVHHGSFASYQPHTAR